MPDPDPSPLPPCVQIDGVHKSFGEHHVLRGIDLAIGRGELVAIVGNSGGGKSVLLHCIIAHIKPDAGRISVADLDAPGTPLRDLSGLDEDALDNLRVHWAVVFQKNALFTGTVYENLALWPREIRGDTDENIMPRARAALTAVGLDPDEVLTRARDNLSGGMAKRVAVARAIVMDPAMIFYDEPTAGLDPEHASLLHELISTTHEKRTAQGIERTTIVITHDTALLARLRPRVVMLHEGVVFFDGTYQDFAATDSPVIRPYFEMMPALHRHAPSGV